MSCHRIDDGTREFLSQLLYYSTRFRASARCDTVRRRIQAGTAARLHCRRPSQDIRLVPHATRDHSDSMSQVGGAGSGRHSRAGNPASTPGGNCSRSRSRARFRDCGIQGFGGLNSTCFRPVCASWRVPIFLTGPPASVTGKLHAGRQSPAASNSTRLSDPPKSDVVSTSVCADQH